MSIQMTLIFGLLVAEGAVTGFLLLPLPPKFQKHIVDSFYNTISKSNFIIILSFIDALVGILFVDSFKNGFGLFSQDDIIEYGVKSANVSNSWDTRSKRFYSQRNLYILGAVLALQASIWFIMMLLRSTVKNKTKLVNLAKSESNKPSKSKSKSNSDTDTDKDADLDLDNEISKLQIDVDTLNKQYDALYKEYQDKKGEPEKSSVDKKDI